MSVQPLIADSSPSAWAAAAGWLAGWAEIHLGTEEYRSRVVARLTDGKSFDPAFILFLKTEIDHECRRWEIRPPDLKDFFQPCKIIPDL